MNSNAVVPLVIFVFVFLIWIVKSINILQEYERGVVFRLGRVRKNALSPNSYR